MFFFLFGVHIAVAITYGLRAHRCVEGSNIHVPEGPRLINARGNFHNWRQTQRRESYSPHTKQRSIGQLFVILVVLKRQERKQVTEYYAKKLQ